MRYFRADRFWASQNLGEPESGRARIWASQNLGEPDSGRARFWASQNLGETESGRARIWASQNGTREGAFMKVPLKAAAFRHCVSLKILSGVIVDHGNSATYC